MVTCQRGVSGLRDYFHAASPHDSVTQAYGQVSAVVSRLLKSALHGILKK